MPNKMITYDRAKREINRLQEYVNLIDNYEIKSIEDWIIYHYAITNSIKKIMEKVQEENKTHEGQPIDREFVTNVIAGNPTSELHRILRLGYRQRIRPKKKMAARYRAAITIFSW